MMFFAFSTLLTLVILVTYVEGLNVALGTRDLIFQHIGIQALPFGLLMQVWNEGRKTMVFNIIYVLGKKY